MAPEKMEWLESQMQQLQAAGMVRLNRQATCASVAMAVPKGRSYRMVADYRAANAQVELVPWPMPDLEGMASRFRGVPAFCSLDLLQGYWQMPLAEEAQNLFSIVLPSGLYTPTRVPQGMLNATAFFQSTMAEILRGIYPERCMVWVDDLIIWGETQEEMVGNLDGVLARLQARGLYAAAHKCRFFATEMKWCGRLYSGEGVAHDPQRVQGLTAMRRPETVGELMQFLQAANWMRPHLPRFAEVKAQLQALLDERLAGTRRTKVVAKRKLLVSEDWTPERVRSWEAVRRLLRDIVQLSYPKPGWRVLMFPDASDLFWGCCVTQVCDEVYARGGPIAEMRHEPLGFVSGAFKGAQLNWPTVDKEGYAIVATFQRLEYLLWQGVHIFCDHRNLAYIFNPEACRGAVPKAASQRLEHWRTFLGQYRFTVVHIPGVENNWGDLLSRMRPKQPVTSLRATAVYFDRSMDHPLPTKQAIRETQAVLLDQPEVETSAGLARRGSDGAYRVMVNGEPVFWIPDGAKRLQARLMVCAHMTESGHRGPAATLARLRPYCVWSGMEGGVREFVRQCLHCADSKSGTIIPRPLAELRHGTVVGEVLHFDFLHLGDAEGGGMISEQSGLAYLLVLVEDVSGYVWLEPEQSCTAAATARALIRWSVTFGPPKVWVSDTATHFKNGLIAMLAEALNVDHHFAVAHSAWTNGTVERYNREVIRTAKAILSETGRGAAEWVQVVPVVQWALNSAYRERIRSTPFQVMMGRAPPTAMSVLASAGQAGWDVDRLDDKRVKEMLTELVRAQEALHQDVLQRVVAERERSRKSDSVGMLEAFAVGDYVLVARPRKVPKLVVIWTGPWRVVSSGRHVYAVEDIVSGQRMQVHVARMRPYSDASLDVTDELKEVVARIQGECELRMADVLNIGQLDDGTYNVLVEWVGLEGGPTWEPAGDIYHDAPRFLEGKLRKMGLSATVKQDLRKRYGMNI